MKNNRYKIKWHVRQYVKSELMDFKQNKAMLANDKKAHTRDLILVSKRLAQIEAVLQSLNQEDREAAEIIFFDKYTQAGAEIAKGLSKAAYYNVMNKVIYLVAREMDLV